MSAGREPRALGEAQQACSPSLADPSRRASFLARLVAHHSKRLKCSAGYSKVEAVPQACPTFRERCAHAAGVAFANIVFASVLFTSAVALTCALSACGGGQREAGQVATAEPTASPALEEPAGRGKDVPLPAGAERAWLTLRGERPLQLTAEVLRTERQFDSGLMYRTKLPREAAALFIFPQPGDHVFWMKNVSIPLDIVFADQSRTIVGVVRNAVPYSEASLSAPKPSKYVVEMNAGLADEYGVRTGARLEIELDRENCGCKEASP